MKKTFFVINFFLLIASFFIKGENIPIKTPDYPVIPTRPRAPMLIPVTVDLSTTDLYFNFTTAVGNTDITIIDSNNIIVHQETIDTDLNDEFYIPIENWDSGAYSININYGSITLVGSFTL